MQRKKLIIIGGPTASGKTGLAIALAKRFGTEILNCDSRQFYQEISIGTAKPTSKELQQVKHHFVNHCSIHRPYNVGDFEKEAIVLLEQLFATNDKVVMVGGSGLYIKAVCEGLDEFPSVSPESRKKIEEETDEFGLAKLLKELETRDPKYFEKVDRKNAARVIRAIAVIRESGQPYSSFLKSAKQKRDFECIKISTEIDRNILYERINTRVNEMIEKGLLEEVKSVVEYRHLQALQTVGYQEIFGYLAGDITLEEALNLIKRNTRRYAKRQMTWFRNQGKWAKFDPVQIESIMDHIENHS